MPREETTWPKKYEIWPHERALRVSLVGEPYYLLKIKKILFHGLAIYKDVIKINYKEVTNKIMKYLSHSSHKSIMSIGQSEWYNKSLQKKKRSDWYDKPLI